MKEHPIIFTGESVRAILAGRKTQTRRVLKPQPPHWFSTPHCFDSPRHAGVEAAVRRYGLPGDLLWVKETWWMWCKDADDVCPCKEIGLPNPLHVMEYRATHPEKRPGGYDDAAAREYGVRWNPPIYMPRWASRITLRVTDMRIQRVQEISEDDAKAEGCPVAIIPVPWFMGAWQAIHRKHPKRQWEANPWVMAITFERVGE